jgi:uncharacterized protein YndB with AHSA1/START domain
MFKWLFKRGKGEGGGAGASVTRELLSLSRTLDTTPEKAFAVFVERLNTWWPREFTWGKDRLAEIGIEPRTGGRAFERTTDGTVSTWGKVLTLDRPRHIVLAWQIRPDRSPEPEEALASRLDVRFIATDQGKTELLLVHRDFPRHGDGWEKYQGEMAKRWPALIDAYLRAAG